MAPVRPCRVCYFGQSPLGPALAILPVRSGSMPSAGPKMNPGRRFQASQTQALQFLTDGREKWL